MAQVKVNTLFLENECDTTDTILFAIHSSQEIFRVAYLLNKYLGLRLTRERHDLDLVIRGNISFHPLYHFFDERNLLDYYLVDNKSTAAVGKTVAQSGLFQEHTGFHNFLVPEYKNVDYFFKMNRVAPAEKLLSQLKTIRHITAIYRIEIAGLKSYKNLIFD